MRFSASQQQFNKECLRQGVNLNISDSSLGSPCYSMPTLIGVVGADAMRNSDVSLADTCIDTNTFVRSGIRDEASIALANIVNATVTGAPPVTETGSIAIDCASAGHMDNCVLADLLMANALHFMNFDNRLGTHIESYIRGSGAGYQLIYSQKQPALLRKLSGERSALSLVPVWVSWSGGRPIPFPAGMLFSLQVKMPDGQVSLPTHRGIAPLSTVSGIRPLRLTAFGVQPQQRPEMFRYIKGARATQRAIFERPMEWPLEIATRALVRHMAGISARER